MKSNRIGGTPLIICAMLMVVSPSRAVESADPHDHIIRNPPSAKAVVAEASLVSFSTINSIEEAAVDALEYFDATTPKPKLNDHRLSIIGRVRIKAPGVYLKDSHTKLPQGDYYHWIGKVGGTWATGFAETKGLRNVLADVRFAVMSGEVHKHLQVYTHSPEAAYAWKNYAVRKTALPGTPPLPIPPPLPKPPTIPTTPDPPPSTPEPPPTTPVPPPPPSEWRCVEVWKSVDGPDGPVCTVVGWVRVPAS